MADTPSAQSERQFDSIGRELHPDRGLVTPGRSLYERWCDAPGSSREKYFTSMNRADQEHWEKLAAAIAADLEQAFTAGAERGFTEGSREMAMRYGD